MPATKNIREPTGYSVNLLIECYPVSIFLKNFIHDGPKEQGWRNMEDLVLWGESSVTYSFQAAKAN